MSVPKCKEHKNSQVQKHHVLISTIKKCPNNYISPMKSKDLKVLLLLLVCTQTFKIIPLPKEDTRASSDLEGAQIRPGRGYSSDRQQVSSIDCFNVKATPYTPLQTTVRLDSGANYSEIEDLIGVNMTSKGSIDRLNLSGDAGFLKEIRDTQMSVSINYFYLAHSEVVMEAGYGPAGALTYDGLRAYGPQSNPDPHFGLVCGDKLVRSFKVGANLVLSIKLHFYAPNSKKPYYYQYGFQNFGYDFDGVVEILAYQSGGNPSELANIMNSTNCTSSYCAATCITKKMDNCLAATKRLYDYALSNFPNQFSLDDPNTLPPLSIRLAELQDIRQLGLNTPMSYVTNEVLTMRERIGSQLFINQYIAARINEMSLIFPFDKDSRLWESMVQLSNHSLQNTALILDQTSGGILCFREPLNCSDHGAHLLSTLQPIEKLVASVNQSINYKISNSRCGAQFYRISDTEYFSPYFSYKLCQYFDVDYYRVVNKSLSYQFQYMYPKDYYSPTQYLVTGQNLQEDLKKYRSPVYEGTEHEIDDGGREKNYSVIKKTVRSQYAFYMKSL